MRPTCFLYSHFPAFWLGVWRQKCDEELESKAKERRPFPSSGLAGQTG